MDTLGRENIPRLGSGYRKNHRIRYSQTPDAPSPGIRTRRFSGTQTNRPPRLAGHRNRKVYGKGVGSERCAPIAIAIY